jgi:hypothetical protein
LISGGDKHPMDIILSDLNCPSPSISNEPDKILHENQEIPRSVSNYSIQTNYRKAENNKNEVEKEIFSKFSRFQLFDSSIEKVISKSFSSKIIDWSSDLNPYDLFFSIIWLADQLNDRYHGKKLHEYLLREYCWKNIHFFQDLFDYYFCEAWEGLMISGKQVEIGALLAQSIIKDFSLILELVCQSFGIDDQLELSIWNLIIGTIKSIQMRSMLYGTNSIIIVSCFTFAVLRLKNLHTSFSKLMEVFKELKFSPQLLNQSFVCLQIENRSLNIVSYYNGLFLPNFKKFILENCTRNSGLRYPLLKLRATSGRTIQLTENISISSSFKRRIFEK